MTRYEVVKLLRALGGIVAIAHFVLGNINVAIFIILVMIWHKIDE